MELSDFGRLRLKVSVIAFDPNYKTKIRVFALFECFEGIFFDLVQTLTWIQL